MSVTQNPIIGRARQKLGGIVFTTWKGINVIKGKPLTVANPRTDGQLMRRSALTQVVEIGRNISAAINFGFKEQAVGKSAFNAFTGYNLRNSFDYSAPPAADFDPSTMLAAQGTISSTAITSVVADDSANTVTVNWDGGALDPGQSASDLLKVVLYKPTSGLWQVLPASAVRTDGTEVIAANPSMLVTGETVWVYAFFYNSTNRKASDSIATSTIVVA